MYECFIITLIEYFTVVKYQEFKFLKLFTQLSI